MVSVFLRRRKPDGDGYDLSAVNAEQGQKAAIENRLNMEIGGRMAKGLVALHVWSKVCV